MLLDLFVRILRALWVKLVVISSMTDEMRNAHYVVFLYINALTKKTENVALPSVCAASTTAQKDL